MHFILKSRFISSLILLILFLSNGCKTTTEKPLNVVFILVDDLGWADLGCYGSTFYETKNIDAFAQSGMLFTNAYAASPVCSPTRAAILTGKHPSRVNITDWIPGDDPLDRQLLGPQDLHELPLAEITLAETFKNNGYKTFFAGKWHLGDEGFLPEDQGFDMNIGGYHKGQPPAGYYSPYQNPKLPDGPQGEYLTDRLTDESIQFLEKNKDAPFFLYLSYYTVHTPIEANKKHIEYYLNKLSLTADSVPQLEPEHDGETLQNQVNPAYASMVHAMDENVGRLLEKIDSLSLTDNTIIIFTSDNGGLSTLTKNHMAPTSVKPLRAGKGWCYEGGIRVPLIIRKPGMQTERKTCAIPVVSYDFYPTLLDMVGIAPLPNQHQDGVSFLPVLNGKKTLDRDAIFWDYPHYHGSAWTPGAAILANPWKLIEFYETGEIELYNLEKDIAEQNNVANQYPVKANVLKVKLMKLKKETGAKAPQSNPQFIRNNNSTPGR